MHATRCQKTKKQFLTDTKYIYIYVAKDSIFIQKTHIFISNLKEHFWQNTQKIKISQKRFFHQSLPQIKITHNKSITNKYAER